MIHKLFSEELKKLFQQSKDSPRGRAIKIFQENSYKGPHVGLNVIQPDSYVRPHLRYADESIIHFSGKLCSLLFDSSGKITSKSLISKENPYFLLPRKTFHSIVSLEEDSAIWFVIKGPHDPKNFSEYLPSAPDEKGDYTEYFKSLKREAKK